MFKLRAAFFIRLFGLYSFGRFSESRSHSAVIRHVDAAVVNTTMLSFTTPVTIRSMPLTGPSEFNTYDVRSGEDWHSSGLAFSSRFLTRILTPWLSPSVWDASGSCLYLPECAQTLASVLVEVVSNQVRVVVKKITVVQASFLNFHTVLFSTLHHSITAQGLTAWPTSFLRYLTDLTKRDRPVSIKGRPNSTFLYTLAIMKTHCAFAAFLFTSSVVHAQRQFTVVNHCPTSIDLYIAGAKDSTLAQGATVVKSLGASSGFFYTDANGGSSDGHGTRAGFFSSTTVCCRFKAHNPISLHFSGQLLLLGQRFRPL